MFYAICIVLFSVIMTVLYLLAKAMIVGVGVWTVIPWLGLWFFIAWKLDSVGQRRLAAGRPLSRLRLDAPDPRQRRVGNP